MNSENGTIARTMISDSAYTNLMVDFILFMGHAITACILLPAILTSMVRFTVNKTGCCSMYGLEKRHCQINFSYCFSTF